MVPEGWDKKILGDLLTFKNGLNTDKSQYGKGYKFVNVMDVFGNDIITESKIIGRVQVTEKQLTENQLKLGDVLFNRTSETFDEIAMAAVYIDHAVATFGGFVIRGRPKSAELAPSYSAYAFQANAFRGQAIRLGQGAVRANIGQKDLSKIDLLIPPLPEQIKIAKILSTWDKAISTTEALIDNSKQQKKALMQQLLTGKKRFTGFEGEWEEVMLRDISTLITNGFVGTATPYYTDETGVPYLYGINIKNNKINRKNLRYITNEFHKKQSKTTLNEGDLLMVQSGHIGETAVVTEEFSNSNCHALIVTKLKQNFVFSNFICMYLSSEIGKARLKSLEVGSTIKHINTKDLKKFIVPLPCLKEQKKIASVLTNADKEIELLNQQLADLKQEKKALMQQLLTGKRRVKIDKGEAALA